MAYASAPFGLDQGFDTHRYYSFKKGDDPRRTLDDVVQWIEANADQPYFAYLHLRRPHSPYRPPEWALSCEDLGCPLADGRADSVLHNADILGHSDALDEDHRAHLEQLYQANLRVADESLEPVLRLAAEQGAAIVITSDHGDALGQHGYYGHGLRLWGEVTDIPLIIARPGVQPGTDPSPACTVDILPTLVDWCGLSVPPESPSMGSPSRWAEGIFSSAAPTPDNGLRPLRRSPKHA